MIVPVSFDGSCDVRISEDSMRVYLDIYPSFGDNPIPTMKDIVDKIESLGVVANINEKVLNEKLDEIEKHNIKCLDVCITEGIQPINGKDGRLENCTKKKENFKNFNFDEFHKVNPVISVKEDELIAILHPPTDGEPGFDLFNQKVDPIPGKIFKVNLGSNTQYSRENDQNIIAKSDGFVNMSNDSISITDTFTVNGDIDFKSGNIISKGSLKVKGNVKNEFTLSLSKDIEINGYVGDALIEAGENIIIHGGFLGKGKGIINSEGDVKVKFVENQTIFTRGSLSIVKETLNAKLFVKNCIFSKSSHASIIGGHTIAGESIEINSLGNGSESETIVEVGFDYLKRNSITDNREKLKKLQESLELVDKNLFEYAKMKRLNSQCAEKVKILANEHKKIVAEIETLKAKNLKINSQIYIPTESKILVKGTVFPGVKIGINGRFMIINNPIRSKTFVLSQDNEVIAI